MEELIYRKVFIKSEEDLPKHNMFGDGIILIYHIKDYEVESYNGYSSSWDDYFMREVDWYLQPIPLPTEKEREGEAMTYSSYPAMPDGHPEFDVMRANDFDAGVKWLLNIITGK